jgi:soluble lytic murein transglycosylase-like protein/outer membrane protein assembly factor BamD (BamD/ComL family)
MKCWRRMLLIGVCGLATAAAGILPRTTLAQMLPFEHYKVEPIDARQAFVEGYRAYQNREWPSVIERMELAVVQVPDLIDYALFFQARAQRETGDLAGAAATLRRLTASYPQSVLADQGELDYADIEIKLARPDLAITAARTVADRTGDSDLEQHARLMLARALLASDDFAGAYTQAQSVRERFPTGSADAAARTLAYGILAAHPSVANTSTLEYKHSEGALLLHEGRAAAALEQLDAALAMEPPAALRAELVWLEAQASRGDPESQRAALNRYLALAPGGTHAAAALNGMAHSWWHTDNTDLARDYFNRLLRGFPGSQLAPEAIFEIGRTYEDDGNREAARAQYQRLVARYPDSDAATDARFRAPFMLFMLKQYDAAATEFAAAGASADPGSQRDMFGYWQARALEANGDQAQAQTIYQRVALSINSNYYPALAERKVHLSPTAFPAALASDPVAVGIPPVSGAAQFHLVRAITLRDLSLRDLERPELRAVEDNAAGDPTLRDFVLAEYIAAGAWYDAISAATRMSARGEINPHVAERIRYPRGYWELVSAAAARNSLDPYLVLALIHQESLFNPKARSGSDARGLMQLLPTTADRWAPEAGVSGADLNLYDPSLSVTIGTVYLRNLMGMFGGDQFKAVAAYNGGEHAAAGWAAKYPGEDDQWVENIGFHETRDYVKKVIGGLREYRLIYSSDTTTMPAASVTPGTPAAVPPPVLAPAPAAPAQSTLPPVPSPPP